MSDIDIQRCSACGAPLDAPLQDGKIKCAYCHAINVIRPQEKKRWDSVQCPECGTDNPREAQHCGHCGFELKFNCPNCDALNPYGTAYCLRCGVDIQAELKSQEEEERLEAEEERQIEEEFQQYQEEQKKASQRHDRRIAFLILGILVAILACFAAYSGVGKSKTSTSPQDKQTKTAAAARLVNLGHSPMAQKTALASTQTALAVQQTALRARQTATAENRILFHDDFSTPGNNWKVDNSENSSIRYESGGYHMQVAVPNYITFQGPEETFQSDVRVDVDVNWLSGPKDSYAGILCRYQDNNNFYLLATRNDGYAIIFRFLRGEITAISSEDGQWQFAIGIYTGSSTNHIRADCIGDKLTLYVNGLQVVEATDDSLQTGKRVSLLAGTTETGGADILFDNFYVYRP